MGLSYSASFPVRSGAERATLARRTYGLVFVSVVVTMLGTAFALSQPALLSAVASHYLIAFFCLLAPLVLVMRAPREYPRNILLTMMFTFVEGIFIAPLIAFYSAAFPGQHVVGQAAVLTFGAFGVLSLYALVSRRDFSAWGGFFMVGLWVLIAASLLNLFFRSSLASLWLSAGALLVFGGLLVFDTWRIVRSGQYGEDDYVAAAVNIYLDLLNMFLAILNLLGGGRRS
jgi:FtsH-binding integral membrane protein